MSVWIWKAETRLFAEATGDIDSWELLAADSWFVQDGRVRAIDRHQARFAEAAAQVGVDAAASDDFWRGVIALIPTTGEWFPRVDVLEAPSQSSRALAFRLRLSPPRTKELKVLVPSHADPRSTPGRKGPDIAMLEQLRQQARADHDCDEVLLLSTDGYVIEGATTSVLWWEGETLCVPEPSTNALPGVTSALLLERARTLGTPIAYRRVVPSHLVGHDVWLVNALHGLRRIRDVVDVRTETTHEETEVTSRFEDWRDWLESQRRPIHEAVNEPRSQTGHPGEDPRA